ncbi:MAG TPA: hypothetical protein VKR61_01650 [Bryobacteraceae bacterium]|nr:hypothetical protein [Bryobacteraceae bacterium]
MKRCRILALAIVTAGALWAQSGTKPKASEQDYPAHVKLPELAIGAEYLVHSFGGGGEMYIARDYLVVEVALFPSNRESFAVTAARFALRFNGRKEAIAPQSPEFMAASLRNPDWDSHPGAVASAGPVIFGAPTPRERFPGDPQARTGPPPPRAPDDNPTGAEKAPRVAAEDLAVQNALPEGTHHGPVSGYLYFPYQGRIKRIRKLELEYNGAGGTVGVPLI